MSNITADEIKELARLNLELSNCSHEQTRAQSAGTEDAQTRAAIDAIERKQERRRGAQGSAEAGAARAVRERRIQRVQKADCGDGEALGTPRKHTSAGVRKQVLKEMEGNILSSAPGGDLHSEEMVDAAVQQEKRSISFQDGKRMKRKPAPLRNLPDLGEWMQQLIRGTRSRKSCM